MRYYVLLLHLHLLPTVKKVKRKLLTMLFKTLRWFGSWQPISSLYLPFFCYALVTIAFLLFLWDAKHIFFSLELFLLLGIVLSNTQPFFQLTLRSVNSFIYMIFCGKFFNSLVFNYLRNLADICYIYILTFSCLLVSENFTKMPHIPQSLRLLPWTFLIFFWLYYFLHKTGMLANSKMDKFCEVICWSVLKDDL